MTVLINHMGYRINSPKSFLVQGDDGEKWQTFNVIDESGKSVLSGDLTQYGHVANWHTGTYWRRDFTALNTLGTYHIEVSGAQATESSEPFALDAGQVDLRLISALTYYFKGQRDSGEWAAADKHAPFKGEREGQWDIHGGWFDATGDLGIHMSHQTFTSYFNPQQLSYSVYAFFDAYEQLAGKSPNFTMVRRHLLDEGTFGADALVRRYVPGRSFLRSVNRETAYSIVEDTRKVGFELHRSSWQFGEAKTLNSEKVTDLYYETSLRSGGGIAIAALAAAARHPYPGADFKTEDYLRIAKAAYAYMKENNNEINNDGRTNLVDEYCALYATIELYKSTGEYGYLLEAYDWGDAILKRLHDFGEYEYFTVDKELPFFHPSDEGMPLIGLVRLSQLCDDPKRAEAFKDGAIRAFNGLMTLSRKQANPFQYPKLTAHYAGALHQQFFFPHESAASPWWQGENARIASLAQATAVLLPVAPQLNTPENRAFVQDQIDWILGKNPFDATMMEGYGRNPIQYHFNDRLDFINAPGGVVNGITSGLHDEDDIDFVTKPNQEVADNWRWAEQWIPHASWLLTLLATVEQREGDDE